MNLIRKINLRLKIVIPTIILIILPLIVLLILSQHFLEQRVQHELDRNLKLKESVLSNNFKLLAEKNAQLAAFAASMPEVTNAYEAFHKDTSKFSQAYLVMAEAFKQIDKSVSHSWSGKLRFQFSYPPNRALFRSWTNDPGNDMINFRKSFNIITKDQKYISAVEIGRDGLKIRGIAPIFSADSTSKLLGMVESDQSYKDLLEKSRLYDNEEYAAFLYTSTLKSVNRKGLISDVSQTGEGNELKNVADSTFKLGDYTLVLSSSDNFLANQINPEKLSSIATNTNNAYSILSDSLQYIVVKIRDCVGSEIGIAVFQEGIDSNLKYIRQIKYSIYGIVIATMIFGFILLYAISIWIVSQLQTIVNGMRKMGEGELIEELPIANEDEIGYIIYHLNQLIRSFKKYVGFANSISKGELDAEFKSAGINDHLGSALIELSNNLKKAKSEEEKRLKEDAKAIWANEGHSFFVDILRQSSKDLSELADKVVKGFVEYMGASQGGLFILSNPIDGEEAYLELVSCYAFNQKRFLEKKIKLGVGLVGMCALEKLTYYKTDVPEDYTSIRSGLGFSSPKCLLIVPLRTDDTIFGVLELASLRTYDEFEINFAEHIGENIATALYSTRINARTNELLEQSRRQAEELAAQDVEMRYSMEILETTQEEANKVIQETTETLMLLGQAFMTAEFDTKGILVSANQNFGQTLKLLTSEIEGKHISMFFDEEEYEKIASSYKKVLKGNLLNDIDIRINTRSSFIWIRASLLPFKDASGEVCKVILAATNINEINSKLRVQERELEIINQSLFVFDFDLNGKITKVNEKVSSLLKTNIFEIVNKADLFKFDDLQTSLSLWEILLDGEIFYQNLEIYDVDGQAVRFYGLFYPVFDSHKRIDRIVYFSSSYTKTGIVDHDDVVL